MQLVVLFQSTDRSHYERKLMQRTLQVWQDIWWSGQRGWKLNVRADYHNRLVPAVTLISGLRNSYVQSSMTSRFFTLWSLA